MVESLGRVKLPITLGDKNVKLICDIVEVNIPLLLSKESMKKANTVLDFNKDVAVMFGQELPLISTSSGHYALPLVLSRRENCDDAHLVLVNDHFSATPDYKKIAVKLHKQFCHCPPERLKKFIKTSKLWNGDKRLLRSIDDVSGTCQLCKTHKKNPPTPIVSLPLATDFNEVVAMDLITVKQGLWIVHLIDMFSRYSVAVSTRTKQSSVISDKIMKSWIAYFGKPRKFIADNGGEFSGVDYTDMCEMFDVEMMKTAAESPWSNGLCERHNGVIKESIMKTMEDSGCSLETATSWATSAKNSLLGHQGFSPNILVFGRNPNYPSVVNSKPPALCKDNITVTVEKNLRAMHAARESFIRAESSEKIKRALRHNIRTSNDIRLQNGDSVYFKRNDSRKWHGPGKVIGQHSQQVVVKVGSGTVTVHTSRIMPVDDVRYDALQSQPAKKSSASTAIENNNDLPPSLFQHYGLYYDDEDSDSDNDNPDDETDDENEIDDNDNYNNGVVFPVAVDNIVHSDNDNEINDNNDNNNGVVFPVAVDVDALPPVEHEIDVVPLIADAVGVNDAIEDIILAVTPDPEVTDDSEYQNVAESPSEIHTV